MEDSIISFETAVLAKEKGFTKGNAYNSRHEKLYFDTRNGNLQNWHYFNSFDNMLDATTQSLLQKWLRETHNIHVETFLYERGGMENLEGYHYNVALPKEPKDPVNWISDNKPYPTWEAALEEGLKIALQQIKIDTDVETH